MAAQATQQVISNGPRNLILKYTIGGDSLLDVSADTLVDISSLDSNIGVSGYRLERAQWSLTGMSAKLAWESGATDVDLIQLADGDGEVDFSSFGGVVNNATLPTGNIVYTTTGYGTAGDGGSMVLEFKKKSSTTVSLQQDVEPGVGSVTITGLAQQPKHSHPVEAPGTGSLAFTGLVPTLSP